ncbi:MAG: phenylacetic acid degradation bifunctional protein PaaZ [Saprospiraceae bacterium]|jgi:oxepin-CoA hydrolase/3-oxo-5,6-dehydrosuberyl-CoA semialdehyde dehydrogenase|nr:phenylacetic acid degradation bifunctional protein PaaZ [Saprospiraceae bacterium]
MKLYNFAVGRWVEGTGQGQTLYDASTGAEVAIASSDGLDFDAMLDYGRKTGNKNLRRMTFQERGRMLKALAMYLMERKEKYYESSYKTGATRVDSWIDIEGGIGNLFANASLRRKFPDLPYFAEGDPVGLSKGGTFMGHHILVPKEGVAVHINAFNFPVWGMLEKCAVNWLAGMPAIVKPATLTSFVTESVVRDIITSGILPDGALQLICGNARTLLDHVNYQDVVTFTGSAATGIKLKSNPNIIREAVPFNMEADSLNSIILGSDAAPGSPEFDLFIKEVRKEITVKCGQKCTAVRRIMVPEAFIEDAQIAIGKALSGIAIGDPRKEGVRMGALAGQEQVREVKDKLNELMLFSEIVYGDLEGFEVSHGAKEKGAYMPPVLLRNDFPFKNIGTHDIEAFGPISTIMPYNDLEDAIELTRKGKGSLCSSIVTFDNKIARDYVIHAATHHGRILVLNRESAAESTGHGSPMPLLVHGGPGRAGGGEEMGGMRGVKHYMQRCAIQGTPTTITAITQQYQYGGNFSEDNKHPFKKYFDELEIGETLVTHKRTVTDADIVNFANVSWDHFYAHTDATALDGTPFTQRVAHGYFVLSAAAGLFVDAAKGPVMLNYGLEECRFTKPVYPGMTIGVRLTVKEKIAQEKRDDEDYTKGIVKWLVDVYDETGETVAIATILTMVKMKANQ